MVAGQEIEVERADEPWLYRQGDLVLGPMSTRQLVEKLYTGEMTADTPVAPPGERDFMRLGDVDLFKVHVARALAKARVDADLRAARERTMRKRMIIGGGVGLVTVLLGIGAWQAARWIAVHGPGGEEDEFANITVDMPTITMAQARASDEDLIAYPTTPGKAPDKPVAAADPRPKPATPSTTTPTTPPTAVAARPPDKKPARTGTVSSDPDGLDMGVEYDQDAINRVVEKNKGKLRFCLAEEVKRRPGFTAKIPIEFTIGNDGRVSKLWVDHPQLKQGPLHQCFLEELRKRPFKPFNGSGPSVGLTFNIAPAKG